MPVLDITSQTRSALRAAAHPLKPVVMIGDKGLTDGVMQEIDRNLSAHGLIKVRVSGDDRAERDVLLNQICETLDCAPVHHLGKIFILFRPTESDPKSTKWLGGKPSEVAALGLSARKPNEPHVPKRYASQGKSVAPAPRREPRNEAPVGRTLTAKERYLGIVEKPVRPSLYEEQSHQRGEARHDTGKRRSGGLKSTLAGGRRKSGSAMSLRAGARRGKR